MSQSNNVHIKLGDSAELRTTMQSFLKELGIQVDEDFQSALDEVGREAAKRLKSTSPESKYTSKRGHYKKGWTYDRGKTKKTRFRAQVYNKTKPGLAHLLEFGHEVIAGKAYKSFGYTKAQPHIKTVDDWVENELPKTISRKISKS